MTDQESVRYVLRAAVEYPLGLYEALWAMRSDYPDMPEDQRVETVRRAVTILLRRGWISLFVQPWQPSQAVADFFEPIPADEHAAVVAAPENWEAPRFNTYVVMAATPEGKKAYNSGALD